MLLWLLVPSLLLSGLLLWFVTLWFETLGFVTFRSNILSLFEEKCEKWNLEEITYGSYVANYGFRNKFCAADVAYACLAVMEQHLETAGVDASSEGGGGGGALGGVGNAGSPLPFVNGLSSPASSSSTAASSLS